MFHRKCQCWQFIKEPFLTISIQNTAPQCKFLFFFLCSKVRYRKLSGNINVFHVGDICLLRNESIIQISSIIFLSFWNIVLFVFCFQFVSISFWTLYTYNRELVYPKRLDGVIPLWLNHAMVSKKHPCILLRREILQCVLPLGYYVTNVCVNHWVRFSRKVSQLLLSHLLLPTYLTLMLSCTQQTDACLKLPQEAF